MSGGDDMVHVICLNKDCKMLIHLDDPSHWNYRGEIKCPKCGEIFELEVKEGSVVSLMRPNIHHK
jgi:phage FluMu protein Com